MIRTKGKPLAKLPPNATRAFVIDVVNGRRKTYGRFRSRALGAMCHLMTWGENLNLNHVIANPHLDFVWVGLAGDIQPDGTIQRRDNFEERL